MFQQSLNLKLEGLMVKRDLSYASDSRKDWAKLKPFKDLDLVLIGGYWG